MSRAFPQPKRAQRRKRGDWPHRIVVKEVHGRAFPVKVYETVPLEEPLPMPVRQGPGSRFEPDEPGPEAA